MSAFFQSSGVSADCCDLSKIVENHLAVTSDSSFDTCVCMPSHTADPAMSKWVTSGLTLFFNCGYCFTLQTLLGGTWEAGEQALPVKTKANWVPQPFSYCFSQGPTEQWAHTAFVLLPMYLQKPFLLPFTSFASFNLSLVFPDSPYSWSHIPSKQPVSASSSVCFLSCALRRISQLSWASLPSRAVSDGILPDHQRD